MVANRLSNESFFTDAHNDTRHDTISRVNVREREVHAYVRCQTRCVFEGVLYTHTKGYAAGAVVRVSEANDDNITGRN